MLRGSDAACYTICMRHILAAFIVILLLAVPWLMYHGDQAQGLFSFIQNTEDQVASLILAHHPKTIADIKSNYNAGNTASNNPSQKKVRILLVPGHEPDYGGAEYVDATYGHMYERDMTVELAKDLEEYLGNNPHYETYITRDTQAWTPTFADYFKSQWDNIIAWQKANKQQFSAMVAAGSTTKPVASVEHNFAPGGVALRLFGITKWSNENDIDIEIHIHFNDYPGHGLHHPGDYSGIAIYVPAAQYKNGTTTRAIADTVFTRLEKYNPVSDLPGESVGVVDDPELIALGANDTADAASMLVEYGYIYEPQLVNTATRSQAIKDMAFQTYLGLQDFFDPNNAVNLAGSFDTLIMPHTWNNPITPGAAKAQSADIYALQTALILDGEYPPASKSMNDCPRTGSIGPCTKAALEAFQKKYGIVGESGVVGARTVEKLNGLYGRI